MLLLVSSAVVLVWMVSLAWGQLFDKPAFDTGYAARRYLWYFSIMNTFDTCLVEYIMGEVALRSPSRSQLVYLRVRQDERRGQCIHGRDEQGIDSVLQARCTSYPFVIPDSARISFFEFSRVLSFVGKAEANHVYHSIACFNQYRTIPSRKVGRCIPTASTIAANL